MRRMPARWLIGGGISNDGTLTVRKSTFVENAAARAGGAIFNGGTAIIEKSTFSGNRSDGLNDEPFFSVVGLGGGIFTSGPLTVEHSTVTQNSATGAGGGIYVCVDGSNFLSPGPAPLPPAQAPSGTCHGTLTLKHTSVTENTPDNIFP